VDLFASFTRAFYATNTGSIRFFRANSYLEIYSFE